MSDTLQETPVHTRLRDFGAFQVDISTFATREIATFEGEAKGTQSAQAIPEHEVAIPRVIPVKTPLFACASPLKSNRSKFGGAIKLIPFRASVTPGDTTRSKSGMYSHSVPQEAPRIRKKKWLTFSIRLALTLLMFALLFKSLSWSALFGALAHIRHSIMLVSLMVGSGGVVLSAYQWRSLLQGEQIRFDLAELINLYVVGIAFNHFLPTGMGGDTIKALFVGRESGNSAGSASAVILCRITGFLSMMLVAFPVLILWHEHLTSELIEWFGLLSLLVGSMIGGAIVAVGLLPRLFKEKWATVRVFASALRVGTALFMAAKRPRSMCIAILYGIAFWIAAILNSYAYADSLGIHASLYFFCVSIPLISLVSFLPISINGFGLRESAYVYAFSTIHVSAATALLLALLLDAQALLFGVVGGCLYITLLSKKKAARMGEHGTGASSLSEPWFMI